MKNAKHKQRYQMIKRIVFQLSVRLMKSLIQMITNVKSVQILPNRNLMVKLASRMFVRQHKKLLSLVIVKTVIFTRDLKVMAKLVKLNARVIT